MKPIPCYQVDAFTDQPFAGNSAAVCVLEAEGDSHWMQQVATEMNLSETAFLRRLPSEGETDWELRWFTPAYEVDLCGHATLASAHALWDQDYVPSDSAIRFHTRSGVLTTRRKGTRIEMDFPNVPVTAAEPPEGLLEALGAKPVYTGQTSSDRFLVLVSEAEVLALQPDFRKLRAVDMRGVMVTAPAENSESYDFVSRFFAPQAGIDEDPVTGSAHCSLGPYWAEKLGKNPVTGFQASARGGVVEITVEDTRVTLGGDAVTIWRGELLR